MKWYAPDEKDGVLRVELVRLASSLKRNVLSASMWSSCQITQQKGKHKNRDAPDGISHVNLSVEHVVPGGCVRVCEIRTLGVSLRISKRPPSSSSPSKSAIN